MSSASVLNGSRMWSLGTFVTQGGHQSLFVVHRPLA